MGEYDDDSTTSTMRSGRSGRHRPRGRGRQRRPPTGRRARLLHDVGVRRWRTGAMVFERDVERLHPVMQASRVPRRRLLPGVVVLARVPFELDGPGPTAESLGEGQDKVRPVVVVEVVGDEFVGRPCTSAASRLRHPWAYTEVQDLTAAGLTRKTGIRRREVTLPLDACIEVSGVLAERDLAKVLGE